MTMGATSRRWLSSAGVIRRSLLALLVVLGVVALSSCSSTDKPDVVASVDGVELTRDDLDAMLKNEVVQDGLGTGELNGDQASLPDQADRVISIWIVLEAVNANGAAQLDDQGAAANQVLTTAGGNYQSSFESSAGVTRDLITRYISFQTQLQAGTLDSAKLQAAVKAADVHVDSRYGYWDAAQASVIPFGTDTATTTVAPSGEAPTSTSAPAAPSTTTG